jgi:hypothetical protein
MSLSFFAAVDDLREAAMAYRLPGPRPKFLWATILSQVAKRDACDGVLADLLLKIIREYLKKPSDKDILAMWLQTESGGGDEPEEVSVRRTAWPPEWEAATGRKGVEPRIEVSKSGIRLGRRVDRLGRRFRRSCLPGPPRCLPVVRCQFAQLLPRCRRQAA